MYKIIFKDGTEVTNLDRNCNTFIAEQTFNTSVLTASNLSKITIVDLATDIAEEWTNVEVTACGSTDEGNYWVALNQLSQAEIETKQLGDTITDMELAIVEMYEMIIGGN